MGRRVLPWLRVCRLGSGLGLRSGVYVVPLKVDRIWGIWGACYNIPKGIFYLLKGDCHADHRGKPLPGGQPETLSPKP